MAMVSNEITCNPALVRRYEALGTRAWPAACVSYDGAWAVRLTPGLNFKRLNSVNPLDPGDTRDMDARIEHLSAQFKAAGKQPCFRLTPLAPRELDERLEKRGWVPKGETIVMQAELAEPESAVAAELMPVDAVADYVSATLENHEKSCEEAVAFTELLGRVRPAKSMFVLEENGAPAANILCVQDRDYAGIFDLCTRSSARRKGHATKLMHAALSRAQKSGARMAWLQVEADNQPAMALCRQLGFSEVYRYAYRESEES